MAKTLYRSRRGSIAGVCQGLADWSGISVGVIRLVFIITAFLWGATIWIYLLLSLIISKEPVEAQRAQAHENYRSYAYRESNFQERQQPREQSSGLHNESLTDEIRRKKKESDWDSKFHKQ